MAKARGVGLPLVSSDHADWAELAATVAETAAPETWVTHGNEEALVHHATGIGLKARALTLLSYGDEEV